MEQGRQTVTGCQMFLFKTRQKAIQRGQQRYRLSYYGKFMFPSCARLTHSRRVLWIRKKPLRRCFIWMHWNCWFSCPWNSNLRSKWAGHNNTGHFLRFRRLTPLQQECDFLCRKCELCWWSQRNLSAWSSVQQHRKWRSGYKWMCWNNPNVQQLAGSLWQLVRKVGLHQPSYRAQQIQLSSCGGDSSAMYHRCH